MQDNETTKKRYYDLCQATKQATKSGKQRIHPKKHNEVLECLAEYEEASQQIIDVFVELQTASQGGDRDSMPEISHRLAESINRIHRAVLYSQKRITCRL